MLVLDMHLLVLVVGMRFAPIADMPLRLFELVDIGIESRLEWVVDMHLLWSRMLVGRLDTLVVGLKTKMWKFNKT